MISTSIDNNTHRTWVEKLDFCSISWMCRKFGGVRRDMSGKRSKQDKKQPIYTFMNKTLSCDHEIVTSFYKQFTRADCHLQNPWTRQVIKSLRYRHKLYLNCNYSFTTTQIKKEIGDHSDRPPSLTSWSTVTVEPM